MNYRPVLFDTDLHWVYHWFMELNRKQILEALGVSRSTIIVYQNQGMPYKKKGRKRWYDYSKVMRWIEETQDDENK